MATKTIKVVESAIDVLDASRAAGGTAVIPEISRQLPVTKSTVHRLLAFLLEPQIEEYLRSALAGCHRSHDHRPGRAARAAVATRLALSAG